MGNTRLCAVLLTIASMVGGARAQAPEPILSNTFQVPAGELAQGLDAYSRQSGVQLIYRVQDVQGLRTPGVYGVRTAEQALAILLSGTRLKPERDASGAIALVPMTSIGGNLLSNPGSDAAAEVHREQKVRTTELEGVSVTAQKRIERLQDVPMAVSVLSGDELESLKIDGGNELLRGAPNATFSKTNFATHNFQIRGVGTQGLSPTSDSGVAINYNGMPLVRNRFYEQEYFDVSRIEILRGPQGSLHSRNATAGVIDMIPNLPGSEFGASIRGETGNFDLHRLSGTFNQPISAALRLRIAGFRSERDGIDYNTLTGRRINDRSLWGTRLSVAWEANKTFGANLIWERFREEDRRARTGKQLCHTDYGPDRIGHWSPAYEGQGDASFAQGCRPGSLYSDDAFGVPNGYSMPQLGSFTIAGVKFLGARLKANGRLDELVTPLIPGKNPLLGIKQSRDLRTISTEYDPEFHASNDTVQINAHADVGDQALQFQAGWSRDDYWSTQDYGRFASKPIFSSSDGLYTLRSISTGKPVPVYPLLPGGVFNDPQLGSSKGIRSADLSRSSSRQRWQEIRLNSNSSGLFNYNIGMNQLHAKIDEDYFVFNNLYTLQAMFGVKESVRELPASGPSCNPGLSEDPDCIYVDYSPIDKIKGDGHNYFRSRTLARLHSIGLFGEGYWKVADAARLTIGVRFTRDSKVAAPIPSQLLLTSGRDGGGSVQYGYPKQPEITQRQGAFTGRLVFDWKPELSFTDSTLVYASLTRGYKAGGTNPTGIGASPDYLDIPLQPQQFSPEFVVSFELGAKSVLLNGALEVNATAFRYDYRDYQVSKYLDRSVFTENFDAGVLGAELEVAWMPNANWRIDGRLGLLHTRIAKGERSIDVMNRTQGRPDWVLVRPWVQLPSNCVVPTAVLEKLLLWTQANHNASSKMFSSLCSQALPLGSGSWRIPPESGVVYDPTTYPDMGQNRGQGFFADLGGKELPNAPHHTLSLGAQYTWSLNHGWQLNLRGDYFQQGASWARVYNAVNDRMRGWTNANLSLTLSKPYSGLGIQLYIKNVLDRTPITGTFINGDDSGLTTNVFTGDPRVFGLVVSKDLL